MIKKQRRDEKKEATKEKSDECLLANEKEKGIRKPTNLSTLNTNVMTTQEIASKLADYCRKGEFETAQKELFSDDAVSIEPEAMPGFAKETKGREAMQEKMKTFQGMVEERYGNKVSEPVVAANAIAFKLDMDVKMKGRDRSNMSELCVYEVKDGKVVSEQFFW